MKKRARKSNREFPLTGKKTRKRNPVQKNSGYWFVVYSGGKQTGERKFWTGRDTVTDLMRDAVFFKNKTQAKKAADFWKSKISPKHSPFIDVEYIETT